jgi:hypothetical protein
VRVLDYKSPATEPQRRTAPPSLFYWFIALIIFAIIFAGYVLLGK